MNCPFCKMPMEYDPVWIIHVCKHCSIKDFKTLQILIRRTNRLISFNERCPLMSVGKELSDMINFSPYNGYCLVSIKDCTYNCVRSERYEKCEYFQKELPFL